MSSDHVPPADGSPTVGDRVRLSIRIDLGPAARLGPGKVALLEHVAALGSIAAAGRAMGMSYRRAWELIAQLNNTFAQPLVAAKVGGRRGGSATLTPLGEELVMHYRAIEAETRRVADVHLQALEASFIRR